MKLPHALSVCFDLDGTLVDTAPDLVRVLNEVIAEEGLKPTEFDRARNEVGYGARRLITSAFSRADHSIADGRVDELVQLFLERYEGNIAELSQPFPGVLDTLAEMKRNGFRLSVCTNKPGYLARPLIKTLKMEKFFERVVGSRDGVPPKPSAEHVFACAGHRDARRIVMIGDSMPDSLAARAAGVPCIIMRYGYANMPISRLRADRTLRNFRDLPAAISELELGKSTRNFQSN